MYIFLERKLPGAFLNRSQRFRNLAASSSNMLVYWFLLMFDLDSMWFMDSAQSFWSKFDRDIGKTNNLENPPNSVIVSTHLSGVEN